MFDPEQFFVFKLRRWGRSLRPAPAAYPRNATLQTNAVATPSAVTVKGSSRQSMTMDCSWTNRLPTPRERHAPFVAVVGHSGALRSRARCGGVKPPSYRSAAAAPVPAAGPAPR